MNSNSTDMKISFVIPCYNTTDVIYRVLEEISSEMEKRKEYGYEIILVNDASPDKSTLTRLQKVVDDNTEKEIILVDLARNSGQPNAILAGCRCASGDYVMTSDDDGQTPMDQTGKFIDTIGEGYDVVCAKYTKRPQKSVIRRIGSKINQKMANMLIPRPDHIEMSTIFLAKKFVVDEIIKYDQPYAYISGLILRVTKNIGNVDVEQRERDEGSSGYTLSKLIRLWINGATAFSIKPLRIADGVGMTVAMIGFVTALVTIIKKLLFVNFQAGWSSLVSIMLILFGINLLVLGIAGEYIGRMYLCINKTPQAVIRSVYRKNTKE